MASTPAIDKASSKVSALRAIVVAEVDAAMRQAQRNCAEFASMPNHLVAACMWLAASGEFEASEGERYFGITPEYCRGYLASLTPDQRMQEVSAGHRVLFEGDAPLAGSRTGSFDGEIVSPSTAAEIRQLGMRRAA